MSEPGVKELRRPGLPSHNLQPGSVPLKSHVVSGRFPADSGDGHFTSHTKRGCTLLSCHDSGEFDVAQHVLMTYNNIFCWTVERL